MTKRTSTPSKLIREPVEVGLNPSCPNGYSRSDLERIFTPEELTRFREWMIGQTCMLCTGEKYNHEAGAYFPSECADNPHGVVAYRWDVERYIEGGLAKSIFD